MLPDYVSAKLYVYQMADYKLLRNVHLNVAVPQGQLVTLETVAGDYEYWHYGCDGFDDRGWGCGYRTLQTIASWILL